MLTYLIGTYWECSQEHATVLAFDTAMPADVAKKVVAETTRDYVCERIRKGEYADPGYDLTIGDVIELVDDEKLRERLKQNGIDLDATEPYQIEIHDWYDTYVSHSDIEN